MRIIGEDEALPEAELAKFRQAERIGDLGR